MLIKYSNDLSTNWPILALGLLCTQAVLGPAFASGQQPQNPGLLSSLHESEPESSSEPELQSLPNLCLQHAADL